MIEVQRRLAVDAARRRFFEPLIGQKGDFLFHFTHEGRRGGFEFNAGLFQRFHAHFLTNVPESGMIADLFAGLGRYDRLMGARQAVPFLLVQDELLSNYPTILGE